MIRVIEYFAEIVNWVKIMLGPLLVGAFLGAAVYFPNPTPLRLGIGIFIASLGLVAGIFFARHVCNKIGTTNFLTKVHASPDIDAILRREAAEKAKAEEEAKTKVE